MTTMPEQELLPCPFCGGESTTNAYDRGINIGCGSCGYSRHFPGLLRTVRNDKPIVQYRNGAGGITEIPASEATEFYHADAHERAADAWNRRTTSIQPVAAPEPVGHMLPSDIKNLPVNGHTTAFASGMTDTSTGERSIPIYTAAPAQAAPDAVRSAALVFADDVISNAFDGGDLDGGTVQEMAEARGLIKPRTVTEPCGDVCNCMEAADFPTTCYRKTYMAALRTSTAAHAATPADSQKGEGDA